MWSFWLIRRNDKIIPRNAKKTPFLLGIFLTCTFVSIWLGVFGKRLRQIPSYFAYNTCNYVHLIPAAFRSICNKVPLVWIVEAGYSLNNSQVYSAETPRYRNMTSLSTVCINTSSMSRNAESLHNHLHIYITNNIYIQARYSLRFVSTVLKARLYAF